MPVCVVSVFRIGQKTLVLAEALANFFSSPSQTIAHKFSIWTPFGVLNFIYKFVSCVTHITSNFLFGSWFANSLTHAKVALSAQEINSALRLRRLEFRVEHSDVVFCNISHTQ